jgi:hypothetical protein
VTATEWTRMALTGRKAGDAPTDTEIEDFQASVVAEIDDDYPCLTTSGGKDLPAYSQWLGYATAIVMRQGGWRPAVAGPLGGSGLVMLETESAGVKEKFGMLSPKAAEQEMAGWEAIIARAKNRIPCVAEIDNAEESAADESRDGLSFGMGVNGFRKVRDRIEGYL